IINILEYIFSFLFNLFFFLFCIFSILTQAGKETYLQAQSTGQVQLSGLPAGEGLDAIMPLTHG
ncbi:MAG TPA: hypothetical protein VFG36_07075, partial [Methanoregula sp.]|nr:hypothetical protein [Methanoregula sp.]